MSYIEFQRLRFRMIWEPLVSFHGDITYFDNGTIILHFYLRSEAGIIYNICMKSQIELCTHHLHVYTFSTFGNLFSDEHYALYFTSTSPQHLRLTMINAEPTDKITMEIFYAISNRYLLNSNLPANAIKEGNRDFCKDKKFWQKGAFFLQFSDSKEDS